MRPALGCARERAGRWSSAADEQCSGMRVCKSSMDVRCSLAATRAVAGRVLVMFEDDGVPDGVDGVPDGVDDVRGGVAGTRGGHSCRRRPGRLWWWRRRMLSRRGVRKGI